MVHSVVVLTFVGIGVGCGYPGGFAASEGGEFPRHRVVVDRCLDAGVGAHPRSAPEAPIVVFAFGNRCDRRIELALPRLALHGKTRDGRVIPLTHALTAHRLAARWVAKERLTFRVELAEICVDFAPVVGAASTAPTCFATQVEVPS